MGSGECGWPPSTTMESPILKMVMQDPSKLFLACLHPLPKTWLLEFLTVAPEKLRRDLNCGRWKISQHVPMMNHTSAEPSPLDPKNSACLTVKKPFCPFCWQLCRPLSEGEEEIQFRLRAYRSISGSERLQSI